MVSTVFTRILDKGTKAGILPGKSKEAREWFRQKAEQTKLVNRQMLLRQNTQVGKNQIKVGSCYMYFYDPKYKQTLPYYDRFPLVFPFRSVDNGFIGLNMHYLPPQYRAVLMDALYDLSSNDKYNSTTKLRLSYDVLNDASKFRYFRPCVKRYLVSQVASVPVLIDPSEWDIALMLPVEMFEKASKEKVWAESRKIFA